MKRARTMSLTADSVALRWERVRWLPRSDASRPSGDRASVASVDAYEFALLLSLMA